MLNYIDGIPITSDIVYTVPTKTRKPRDSEIEFHNWLNVGFKKVYGEHLRSKAVFCSEDFTDAEDFGPPYVIYPKDGFTFYWSNKIPDIYSQKWVKNYLDKNTKIDENILACFALWAMWRRIDSWANVLFHKLKLTEIFSSSTYDDTDRDKYIKYILNTYKNANVELVKKFYNKSSNVNDLENVQGGNEIMLMCKGYYAIRTRDKKDLIKKLNNRD